VVLPNSCNYQPRRSQDKTAQKIVTGQEQHLLELYDNITRIDTTISIYNSTTILFRISETKEKKKYFENNRVRERRENSEFQNYGVSKIDE
jgi:hypothetical protein